MRWIKAYNELQGYRAKNSLKNTKLGEVAARLNRHRYLRRKYPPKPTNDNNYGKVTPAMRGAADSNTLRGVRM